MYQWVALISTILTWPLISLGALVRLKGAGLACPDWPLCYGKIIPPPGFEIALEVGHRFVATVLGIGILVLVGLSFQSPYKQFRLLSWLALLLVTIQGILGGLTVIMKLSPPTVVLHLVGGNLLFALLIYLTYVAWKIRLGKSGPPQTSLLLSRQSKHIGGMLLLFFIILISGGINSSTYSGYACAAFPGCHEGSAFSIYVGEPNAVMAYFFPKLPNEWIHMAHRLIAIVGAGILIFGGWRVLYQHPNRIHAKIALGIWVLLILEILIGITNALYRVPVPISLGHTAIAATLVGLLSFSLAISIYESH